MESKPHHRAVHVCRCPDCQRGRRSDLIEELRAINQLSAIRDQKWRRLFVGFWATVSGRGGIAPLAVITGLRRTTIHRGQKEFLQPEGIDTSRTRKPGGGRKRIEKKLPDRVEVLDPLLQDATAGDPRTALKWTHQSTRKLGAARRRRGIAVSRKTSVRLLHPPDDSLRTNRKRRAGTNHPDRDRQFRSLTRIRRWDLTHGLPVLRVDPK